MNLTTASPAEIDSAIADIYQAAAPLASRADDLENQALRIAQRVRQGGKFNYNTPADVDKAEARAADAQDALALFLTACDPFEAEYTRRGGWTRAWLVLNNNGHVHSNRACSTCYVRTQFGWLPQVSGQPEAEIVAQAGEGACTVCYPSAPVETLNRPRTLLHVSEEEANAARVARANAKAEREAKKAAKAIGPLEHPGGPAFRISTVTAAKSYLTDAAERNTWGTSGAHPWYPADKVSEVSEALATKLGTDVDTEIAAAAKRAAKRR